MDKSLEKKAEKRDFLTVLAETKKFVGWCRDPFVQAEAAELIQEAENEFVDHGSIDRAWNPLNAARRITAEARAKFHKELAEKAIAEAEKKLAFAKASENGFYGRAVKTLEEARVFLTESEKDRKFQIQLLKDAADKASSASRALDLLLTEQENQERRNSRGGQDGPANGSRKALKDQEKSMRNQGYDKGAETAARRRRERNMPWPNDEE